MCVCVMQLESLSFLLSSVDDVNKFCLSLSVAAVLTVPSCLSYVVTVCY